MFSLQEYLTDFVRVLRQVDGASIERLAELVVSAWSAGRTVFICGNGGSAASAGHIAADLSKLTAPAGGPRLRAVALTESLAAISAIGNDLAYDEIFADQLRTFCQRHDVVVGLSTSGSSPNVLRAIDYANAIGAVTIGITGRHGERLKSLAQHTVVINSASVQHVEDATMVAGHLLCLRVREALQMAVLQALGQPDAAAASVAISAIGSPATPR